MTKEKGEMIYGKSSLFPPKDARLLEGGDSFTLPVATVILARVIVVTRPRVSVLII
jgi:hypothetical protein